MNCDKCGRDMELTEHYKRGRRYWEVFFCQPCDVSKIKKGGLVRYNKTHDDLKKGCSVPWGKNKTRRFNPKKKKRKR